MKLKFPKPNEPLDKFICIDPKFEEPIFSIKVLNIIRGNIRTIAFELRLNHNLRLNQKLPNGFPRRSACLLAACSWG